MLLRLATAILKFFLSTSFPQNIFNYSFVFLGSLLCKVFSPSHSFFFIHFRPSSPSHHQHNLHHLHLHLQLAVALHSRQAVVLNLPNNHNNNNNNNNNNILSSLITCTWLLPLGDGLLLLTDNSYNFPFFPNFLFFFYLHPYSLSPFFSTLID